METTYDAICFDLFGTLVEEDARAIVGAAEALGLIPARRWAIVTSCGASFARALLAQAGLPEPRVLISSDDVVRGKPAPDGYALAAQRLGVDPRRALVIEDSRQGVLAGRAAGMDTLVILRGRPMSYAQEALYMVERFSMIAFVVNEEGTVGVTTAPPRSRQLP